MVVLLPTEVLLYYLLGLLQQALAVAFIALFQFQSICHY
jgi:hypothetical protein